MRKTLIFLLLVATLVVAQNKTPDPKLREPISVSANEALELKDTYTNALLADAQWQNRLLRAKVDHGVPSDYVYNMNASRFEAPAPTPTPKEQPKP